MAMVREANVEEEEEIEEDPSGVLKVRRRVTQLRVRHFSEGGSGRSAKVTGKDPTNT